MPVTLVVAEAGDRLAQRVCGYVDRATTCTWDALLGSSRFALLQEGTAADGRLTLAGAAVPFAALSGVLLRPGRRWRPAAGLGARHRAFVGHETHAAWCAVLAALACPVLNRMGPAWWFDADQYAAELVRSFALRLGLPRCMPRAGDLRAGTSADAKPHAGIASAYVIGTHVVAGDGRAGALATHLSAHRAALGRWQRESGIGFARIDVAHGGACAVRCVEPLPTMARAPALVLDDVSRRIAAVLG